ncbi:Vacuolar protein sorting-associated protein 54 [Nymphon striatum]|nr:Vacuolar protein sorting-associated protein 54 [Nymphon striatum]
MSSSSTSSRSWKQCAFCTASSFTFKNPREFSIHLREYHCTKEGGSYICHYGKNGVCSSLPLEGVSDRDYEDHVARNHILLSVKKIFPEAKFRKPSSGESINSYSEVTKTNQPNVVSDRSQYSFYSSNLNLPAVLNDPRKSKRESDFFTKTWGEGFIDKSDHVAPNYALPNVSRSEFESYLARTAKRHKKHLRRSAQIAARNDPSKQAAVVSSLTNLHISNSSLDKNEFDVDVIPKIFLQPAFDLKNQETFQAVLPWNQINSTNGSSSKLLQEKLTHYLDIVEVHIAKQILQRSDAFFHAMSSHDELTDQLEMTVRAVRHLRDKISAIDSVLARGSFEILRKTQSRANYITLYKKLKLMATVHQTQATIQFLLSTSDFVGALDLITTSRDVLSQELAGIQSLRHLSSQLTEIERVIDKVMNTDFLKYITADLNRPPSPNETKVMQEERLVAVIFGQLRLKRLGFVDVYKNEACTAIKALLKQTVIEAISRMDDLNDESITANLADQMRMLKFSDWVGLLKDAFRNIKLIIERIKSVENIMRDAINMASEKYHTPASEDQCLAVNIQLPEDLEPVIISISDHEKLQVSLDNLLFTVCDYSHNRCAKLLTARAKDGFMDKLSASEFIEISQCVEQFVIDCSNFCGRPSTSLRLALRTQASKIINKFHEEKKTKLSLILDNERWKQADVPSEFQSIADHVSCTGILSIPKKISEMNDGEQKTAKYLVVDDEKFAVVGTGLILFRMIFEYCQCGQEIPSVIPELLNHLIDLWKIFNSRTCQLILGAGALQLVGLKTITTKNLALASRCLQLILIYIPKVYEYFEKHLEAVKLNSMCKYFDQISNDYKNHIGEIEKMLVGIIDSMFESQLSKTGNTRIDILFRKFKITKSDFGSRSSRYMEDKVTPI